jgi:hydroxyacyl-ACP dehydratase HTD2-like protein with hotdog domain
MPVDKSWIGRTGEPIVMHIERGKIREFAKAIRDDDSDEEVPPITFLQTLAHWDNGRGRIRPPMDLKRTLHGEQEFEFLGPIRVGDVLTARSRVADLYEKPGRRGGTMTFVVTETEFTNQRSEVVARARAVGIETGQVVKDA